MGGYKIYIKILTEEKGSIIPMFASGIIVILLIAGVAIDYSRYVAASEKLLTATESASMAGALTAKRYVKLEVDKGRYRTCCPSEEGGCTPCCKSCQEKVIISGLERELLEDKGYKKHCCSCGCGKVKIIDRWVEYSNKGFDTQKEAEKFFNLNMPKEMTSMQGGSAEISNIEIINKRSDPRYPSVIIEAKGKIKTLFWEAMDRPILKKLSGYLLIERCVQAGTFYYDINGKWQQPALEGCDKKH